MKHSTKYFVVDGQKFPFIAGGDGSDDSGKKGDDGKGDAGAGKPQTFSQEDVNRMLSTHKRQITDENTALKESMTTQIASLSDLIKTMSDKGADPDTGAAGTGDGENDGITSIDQLKKLIAHNETKSQKQIDLLKTQLKTSQEREQSIELKRRASERDQILAEALDKSDCIDLVAGKRYFRDQMKYDESSATWVFVNNEGLEMVPNEGIPADLPSFMRRTKARSGSGGKTPKAQIQTEITAQKEKVVALKTKATASGQDADIAQVLSAEKALKDLEAALTK